MKTNYLLLALFVLTFTTTLQAQSYLPTKQSFSFGGSMAKSLSECKGDYMDLAGKPLCYNLNAEYRYYLVPSFAIGAAYDYIGSSRNDDKLNCHYIAPTLTLRGLWANGKQGFWCNGGVGYLYYSDKIHDGRYETGSFEKGYFACSIGLGYEFALSQGFGMQIKANFIMADWHFNDNYEQKYSRYHPDEYEYQKVLDNNLSYFTLGIALVLGK